MNKNNQTKFQFSDKTVCNYIFYITLKLLRLTENPGSEVPQNITREERGTWPMFEYGGTIYYYKLKLNDLGIRGDIWLKLSYNLTERRQFVRVDGCDSDTQYLPHGVPQGSVLGPTLFSLFTNDFPKSGRTAETYLYADDTTIYYVTETIGTLINKHNNALADLKKGCDNNLLVPHPEKCKAVIMHGSIQSFRLRNNTINWTTSERLLGRHVDNKMTWSDRVTNVFCG